MQSAPVLPAQRLAESLPQIAARKLHLEQTAEVSPAACLHSVSHAKMLLQLKSSKYGSKQDFQADFHQMLEVCRLYNTAASLAAHPGTEQTTTARCTLRDGATLFVHSGTGHITHSHCDVHNAAASLAAHSRTKRTTHKRCTALASAKCVSACQSESLPCGTLLRHVRGGTPQLIVNLPLLQWWQRA